MNNCAAIPELRRNKRERALDKPEGVSGDGDDLIVGGLYVDELWG